VFELIIVVFIITRSLPHPVCVLYDIFSF